MAKIGNKKVHDAVTKTMTELYEKEIISEMSFANWHFGGNEMTGEKLEWFLKTVSNMSDKLVEFRTPITKVIEGKK